MLICSSPPGIGCVHSLFTSSRPYIIFTFLLGFQRKAGAHPILLLKAGCYATTLQCNVDLSGTVKTRLNSFCRSQLLFTSGVHCEVANVQIVAQITAPSNCCEFMTYNQNAPTDDEPERCDAQSPSCSVPTSSRPPRRCMRYFRHVRWDEPTRSQRDLLFRH